MLKKNRCSIAALAIAPNNVEMKAERAGVEIDWKAGTRPLHRLIDSIRDTNPDVIQSIANNWLICALAERDAVAAKGALIALREAPLADDAVQWSRPFIEGVIARMTKDDRKARSAFTAARAEQQKTIQAQPDYGPPFCVLGLIDAGLGPERGSAERRPARDRASSRGKRCNQWHVHDQVFGSDRRMGWRQGSRL